MLIKKNLGLIVSLMAILIVSVIPIVITYKKNCTCKNNIRHNFVFNLDIVSKSNKDKIEFIEAKGKNTKNLSIKLIDNEIFNKRDGKVKTILCECETYNQYTRIDGLKLKINGKEKNINLKFPIENRTLNNVILLN